MAPDKEKPINSVRVILLIIALSIIIGGADCSRKDENCHDKIKIINNSDKTLFFYVSYKYPDTSIVDYNPYVAGNFYKIPSYSSEIDYYRGGCFDGHLQNGSKISYFLFDSLVLATIPWDTVMENYMIVKRYDLSSEDLVETNWSITYP